jgi:hypothetical protein
MQLTQHQWCQSPLPYNRATRILPTPSWLSDRQRRIAGFSPALIDLDAQLEDDDVEDEGVLESDVEDA